jgi:drug/metabolite transporter (DMT)-like permease
MTSVALPSARQSRRTGQAYIAGAAIAWSTAGLLQRQLPFGTATQVAGRALFAFAALSACLVWAERSNALRSVREMGRHGAAVAVATAVASSTFVVALNHTSVANVLFLQALAPLAAVVLAAIWFGEAVSRRTILAMLIALVGVGAMVGAPDGARGLGLVLSLVMTLAFAFSVVITRHHRNVSMLPAVCISQLIVLLVYAPFSSPSDVDARGVWFLAALGVAQMALGLAFLTAGARLIPAGEVALIVLLEVVLGPLWVWLALGERPANATLIGGVIVVAAVALQTGGELKHSTADQSAAPSHTGNARPHAGELFVTDPVEP